MPTHAQLADVLTKAMKADEWWAMIEKGSLKFPFKGLETKGG